MSLYNLATDGIRELSRSGLFRKEKVVREPLDGIPDGSNVVFRTAFAPLCETEDVTVYISGGSYTSGSYTLDYETGTVIFVSGAAPNSQPSINYHWANITTHQFKQILLDGLDTMEAIWPRGFSVSSSAVAFVLATEDDTAIYVVDGESVTDPSCGDTTFYTSRAQRGLYQVCCRIAYLDARMLTAAEDDIDYREDRGITVRRSHRAPNLERAFNAEWKKLERYLQMAFQEYYEPEETFGAYYSMPATEDYLANFEWQYYSKRQDLRTTYRYRGV